MEALKRNIFILFSILLLFSIQSGVLHSLAIGGIIPNLLLIFVISMGILNDERVGMTTGFFCGLCIDIFFMDYLGFYCLLYLYLGYVSGWFHRYFSPQNLWMPFILIEIGDGISGLIYYILFYLLNGRFDFGYYFLHIILAEMIYTLVVAILLYPLLLLIEYKIIRKKWWSKEKDAG